MNDKKAVKIPVITIDGPSGTGKGTVAQLLAKRYDWHWLDSGLIYRGLALEAIKQNIALGDVVRLTALAHRLAIEFEPASDSQEARVFIEKQDVTIKIRHETTGSVASQISIYPPVRQALLERQRSFLMAPGLVTDGRDMGTVVFPEALLKCYLDASLEIRAKRRLLQLKKSQIDGNLDRLLAEIRARDERDRTREVAPLKPADNALIIDTSDLTVEAVVKVIDQAFKQCQS